MNWKEKTECPAVDEKILIPKDITSLFQKKKSSFTMVCAIQGYGKTVSLAAMAQKKREEVLWYSLDSSDNQVDLFCQRMFRLFMEKEVILSEIEKHREKFFSELLLFLKEGAKKQFLIFDNVQEIENEKIFQMILRMHKETQEYLSIVLLTNRSIPKVFLPEVISGKMKVYREENLRIHMENISMESLKDLQVSTEQLQQIIQAWNGWPLGVCCCMQYYRKHSLKEGWSVVLHQMFLEQYLDEYFWVECEVQQQELLKKVCVLQEFNWELCRAISGEDLAKKTYEKLLSERGFLLNALEKKGYYQICDAFRVYLQEMLSGKEKKDTYQKAVEWYCRQGELAKAAGYAVKGENVDFLLETLEKNGQELLEKQEIECVGKIVHCLEEQQVPFSPDAFGNAAQYYYAQGDYEKMDIYLNEADCSFGKENKFANYRSLYRALLKYWEDREKYAKQINHALFALKESKENMPYLEKAEQEILSAFDQKEKNFEEKSLCVQTFGSFSVSLCADRKELAWRTRKGKELFAYLLALDGKPVERRNLMELLWREEIPGNAVAMLHNMIYNIRKELSAYSLDGILCYENKKYFLKMEKISCDLSMINTLAAYVEKKNMTALYKNYEKFLTYWGGYLEDIDNYWIVERREYYEEIYKRGCWLLAEMFLKEKNDTVAVKLYENILLLEPYSEKTVEKILHIYGTQKKWEKVKRCYQEFRMILKKDLGIVPGKEVSQAYHYYLN